MIYLVWSAAHSGETFNLALTTCKPERKFLALSDLGLQKALAADLEIRSIVRVTEINFDVDDDDDGEFAAELEAGYVGMRIAGVCPSEIADFISDKSGYCVRDCKWEFLP